MMTGTVLDRHALLSVTFRLTDQPDLSIEFVVDTGFTGCLTMPQAAVSALRLPYHSNVSADLADDSVVLVPIHTATIVWDGVELEVPVLATGRRPLLGTALLSGQELRAHFVEGGTVTIEAL